MHEAGETKPEPYRAYAVSAAGIRSPINADRIVISLGQEKELIIHLVPHANDGKLLIMTDFDHVPERTHISTFALWPGAANGFSVSIERVPYKSKQTT